MIIVLSGTIIVLLMMAMVFYLGHRIAAHHAPLVDASMELKLEVTTAHLWFEEIVSGDTSEPIDVVWESLDLAEWYGTSLLHGGSNQMGTYPALEDEQLRKMVTAVLALLAEFRQVTEFRYHQQAAPGTEIDQQYDALFREVLALSDAVELAVLALIEREYTHYYRFGYLLLGLAIAASFFTARLIYSKSLINQDLVASIAETNRTIEAQNRELDYKAHFDALTGLPNRVLFLDRINQAILQAKRDGDSFALLYVDFDHFKQINDIFGHAAGDHVLWEVAQRMLECIRESDTAARISGDEFGIIIHNRTQRNLQREVCSTLASKLNQNMRTPIAYLDHKIHSSVSIGIAIYPENGESAEQLMSNADAAMYHAKTQGKDRYWFYTPELGQAIHDQNQNLSLIRNTLKADDLVVHYQPQIMLDSRNLYGFEALVRIHHDNQLMMPYEFIPIAEKFGIIDQIDFQVFRQALHQARVFIDARIDFQRISVNVSTLTLLQNDFLSRVKDGLRESGMDGSRLEFEITESALVKDFAHTTRLLQALHELGIRIAIDDFGTGYSSMSYLRDLKVDSLKIDRSFVSNYRSCPSTEAILHHIVQLGHALKLDIIAEGIEHEQAAAHLLEIGCNIGQGYLFAKPAAPDQLIERMKIHDQPKQGGFLG
ncbi:MAG: EAL domain-containing protein [Candidatus Thiodiazotropha sp.]